MSIFGFGRSSLSGSTSKRDSVTVDPSIIYEEKPLGVSLSGPINSKVKLAQLLGSDKFDDITKKIIRLSMCFRLLTS